jgi:hypothetical protein
MAVAASAPPVISKIDFKKIGSIFLKNTGTFATNVQMSIKLVEDSFRKALGGGLVPAMKNTSIGLFDASRFSAARIIDFFRYVSNTTVQASGLMIGDVQGVLQRLRLSQTSLSGVNLVRKMQKGASVGASIGNVTGRAAGMLPMLPPVATQMLIKNIGALGGAVTVAGAQFGLVATKMSAQVSLAVLQAGLKLTPFGGLMISAATGVMKAGNAFVQTKGKVSAAYTQAASSAQAANWSISKLSMAMAGLK